MPTSIRARGAVPRTALAILLPAMILVATPPPPAAAGPVKVFDGMRHDPDGTVLTHVRAAFTSSGNQLVLDLSNLGPASRSKSDILTSFYFKLFDPVATIAPENVRLSWGSASGMAFQVLSGKPDVAAAWTPRSWLVLPSGSPSSLVATKLGDHGWQLRGDLVPTPEYDFTFGIGTVGNSDLSPFGFSGGIVNGTPYPGSPALPGHKQGKDTMINLGIYSSLDEMGLPGDIDPDGGLDGSVLVRDTARFVFESDNVVFGDDPRPWLRGGVMFGFGTGPDHVIHLPEPGTLPMAATAVAGGALVALGRARRRKAR